MFQDAQYPAVVAEIGDAITAVSDGSQVAVRSRDSRCTEISAYSSRWHELFPQHGPGRKHERAITLRPWQRTMLDAHPELFIRGLIHSDGCRCVARQRVADRVYEYPRYFFSNRSEDIKAILCEYLDLLGIAWNRPNDMQIQVSRRAAVAAMEKFVGPKS